MKKMLFVCILLLVLTDVRSQRVRVRLGFPAGVSIAAPGPAPFAGAVWIAPEWRWQRGRYVHVPGYWTPPRRHYRTWVPGHWQYKRRGYCWVPGRWR
jgi:hypothetical protein